MELIAERRASDRRFQASLHDKEIVAAGDPVAALPTSSTQGRRRREHMRAMKARNRGAH